MMAARWTAAGAVDAGKALLRDEPLQTIKPATGYVAGKSGFPVVAKAMAEDVGLDSDGRAYSSRREMWVEEAGEDLASGGHVNAEKKEQWYRKGVCYWEGVQATVNGVLGGYGNVNGRDVADSNVFIVEMLRECIPARKHDLVALDCGAGVGRVTRNLLLRHFSEVDLVEPVRHFIDAAALELKKDEIVTANSGHRAVNFFCESLQNFTPQAGRYDVIWVQWCIGHLTDHDFVAFFQRAKIGLKPGGFFVLKENTAKHGFVVDREDSSVTRSDAYFQGLFQQCGLALHKTKMQRGFPKDLFSVRMYGLLTSQLQKSAGQGRRQQRINHPSLIL